MSYQSLFQQYMDAAYCITNSLIGFFYKSTQGYSPIEIAVQGRATMMVSQIEIIALGHRGNHTLFQQNTCQPDQKYCSPVLPYIPKRDSKKSKGTRIYNGEKAIRSRQLYEARRSKKPNRKPVSMRQNRLRKTKIPFTRHSTASRIR